jgi:hypothetical protein
MAVRKGQKRTTGAGDRGSGPVTLAQARALAGVRPASDARRAAAGGEATPASVGRAREDLERERRRQRAQRRREYAATMRVLKRRGAVAAAGTRGAAAAFTPLQAVAEGDSWFDYPVPFFGGGLVPRLERRLGVPILNLAEAGDEVRFMLGVDQRRRLANTLRDGCPAGGPWDVLLFSGGGNDIVSNPLALWLRDWRAGALPAAQIDQPRFDAALALVRAGYEDLIVLRDSVSPNTHLVFHAYDYAIPDGRGICHLGPWLKPAFDLRGFPTLADSTPVVREMLRQFAAMLKSLPASGVTVIDGQGTLSPGKASWHNELHPSKAGFERFADLFQAALRARFPGRVA